MLHRHAPQATTDHDKAPAFCDTRRGETGTLAATVVTAKSTNSDATARLQRKRRRVSLAIDVTGSYGRGVLKGIMAFAKTRNWIVDIQLSDSDGARADEWNVDGVIAQAITRPLDRRIVKGCLKHKVPMTNVSNMFGGSVMPTVLPDDEAVGRLAADYFAGRGFTRFAFFGYRDRGSYSESRRHGFAQAVARKGGRLFDLDAGRAAPAQVGQWAKSLPVPVGVLCCNDRLAYDFLSECQRAGVAVPDDLAVLGVDDDELVNTLISPSLSSVTLPTNRIGFEAASLLQKLMDGHDAPTTPMLFPPVSVVTRQSTDITALEDRDVSAALLFIRKHVTEAIGVEDVVAAVAISRRSLERRFQAALGRSVLGEMRHRRVERAKELLAMTDLAMPAIARASGFGDATRLGIVFRQVTGQPPTEFRRQVRPSPA